MVVAVGELAVDVPELAELDLNPVVVTPSGPVLVDVKARLAAGQRNRCRHPSTVAGAAVTVRGRAASWP